MSDKELNEKLCKSLGFKESFYKMNGERIRCWKYPERYKHLQVDSPAHRLPDMIGLLDDAIEFANKRCAPRNMAYFGGSTTTEE